VANIKISVFWDEMPRSLVALQQRFKGTYIRLHALISHNTVAVTATSVITHCNDRTKNGPRITEGGGSDHILLYQFSIYLKGKMRTKNTSKKPTSKVEIQTGYFVNTRIR
jgi:hypothetical protein